MLFAFICSTLITRVFSINYIFTINNKTKLHFTKDERFLKSLSISQTCLLFGYLTPTEFQSAKYYPTLINLCGLPKQGIKIVSIIEDMIYLSNHRLTDKAIDLTQQIIIVDGPIVGDNRDQSKTILYQFSRPASLKCTYKDKLSTQTGIRLRFIKQDTGERHITSEYLEEILVILNLLYPAHLRILKAGGENKYILNTTSRSQDTGFSQIQSEFEKWNDVDVVVAVGCQTECDYSVDASICTSRAIAFIDVCSGTPANIAYRLHLLVNNILFGPHETNKSANAFTECLSTKTVKSSVLCGNGVIDPGEECDCSFRKDLCNLLDSDCDTSKCLKHSSQVCKGASKLVGVPGTTSNLTRLNLCRLLLNSETATEASKLCYVHRRSEICLGEDDCNPELTCNAILCSPLSNENVCGKHTLFTGIKCGRCKYSDCEECLVDSDGLVCKGICPLELCLDQSESADHPQEDPIPGKSSVTVDFVFISGSLLVVVIIIAPTTWYVVKRIRKKKANWRFNDRKSIDFWSTKARDCSTQRGLCEEYVSDHIYSDISRLASGHSKPENRPETDLYKALSKSYNSECVKFTSIMYNQRYEDKSCNSINNAR